MKNNIRKYLPALVIAIAATSAARATGTDPLADANTALSTGATTVAGVAGVAAALSAGWVVYRKIKGYFGRS